MAAMDASVVHELFTDDGRALLASLPPYEEKNVVMLTTRLRAAGHSPELVAAALTQSRLCLLYTSPSPRDRTRSRMPSSA